MNSIKVSIIVPCWGVEEYLDRCVKSLVKQTLKDIEIILVDDESPDRVPEMCDNWAAKDSRIKVIHKKNEGLGFARNTGIEHVKGKYVIFLDSDDWVEPETYETVYNKAEEKELDICWFQRCRVDNSGKKHYFTPVKEEYFFSDVEMKRFRKDVIGKNFLDKNSKIRNLSSCMALIKRSLFDETNIRYPSERIVASEDFLFMMKFINVVKRVGILPNVFYNYYTNPVSISNTYSKAKHTRLLNLVNEVHSFCKENYEWNSIKNHYYGQLLRVFKVILKFTSNTKCSFIKKVQLINNELDNPLLQELYLDKDWKHYPYKESIYIWMMKHHIALFFIILYRKK